MPKKKPRPDGRFSGYIVAGYSEDGKPKRKYVYAHSEKEFNLKMAELRLQYSKGILLDDKNTTVKEYAKLWLRMNKSTKEHNTKQMYEKVIDNHIIPRLGDIKLKDLKKYHVQQIINEKAEEGLTRTLEIIKLTINQILDQAIDDEFIYRNVAKKVELPRFENRPKRALTDKELYYIENADLPLRLKAYTYTLLMTGIRPGEALALTKKDIDLRENTLTVNKAVYFEKTIPHIKPLPKTDAGFRTIPIPDNLKYVLEEYIYTLDGIYIFPGTDSPLMKKTLQRSLWNSLLYRMNKFAGGTKKIKAIAEDIVPYICRHTYATMLYYAGVDIKNAQYLLGHKSILVTMEIYTHLEASNNSNIPNKIQSYMTNRVSLGCQSAQSDKSALL